MRTTLDIDDELLDALMDQLPAASKTEAIQTAIEAYLSRRSVARLRSWPARSTSKTSPARRVAATAPRDGGPGRHLDLGRIPASRAGPPLG